MNKNIKDLGNAILKKKLYIILITLILAITGVFYTLTNVKYIVNQKFLIGDTDNRMETYKELVKSSVVLEKAIQNLGSNGTAHELSRLIEVETIKNTNMIEMKISGQNEKEIQSYSTEISNAFLETVHDIYENAQIYSIDYTYDYYIEGNVVAIGIGMGVAGFVLSCLFFGVKFLLDTKITSCKEIEEITGLRSLISIPQIKAIEKKKLTIKNLRVYKNEVFKILMTNIQFVNNNPMQSKTILITSTKPFEGKSYVTTNLAIEFAKAGKKVIVIDGDMRRGKLAKIFNLPNDLGLSNYLSNLDCNGNFINERITRFMHDTEIKNLNVITAGNMPPNPTELLRSNKVRELIKDLKVFYDIIIFDTIAVLEAPEASILSKMSDLTLLLSAYGRTKKDEFALAYQKIENADGNNICVGLNNIPDRKIKKKFVIVKNVLKQRMSKFAKSVKRIFKNLKKLSKIGNIIKNIFKVIFGFVVIVLLQIRNLMVGIMNSIQKQVQKIKERIQAYQAKQEKIKLIEAGSMILEEENNIIKEVFESEIAKLESDEDVQYKKKLDELKMNLDEKSKSNGETLQAKPVQIRTEKSKFDLIREQQDKTEPQVIQTVDEKNIKIENIQLSIKEKPEKIKTVSSEEKIEQKEIQRRQEQLIERQKIERERKEAEKKARQEKIENHQEIDFHKQENLTEEMIRKQVEIDEMVRLAEQEKEEELYRAEQMKRKARTEKRRKRKEKFQDIINYIKNIKEVYNGKNEFKIEERLKKESEKNEYRVKVAKEREEKRAFREMERQKYKEELRIQEELQEDNLYPRPRM